MGERKIRSCSGRDCAAPQAPPPARLGSPPPPKLLGEVGLPRDRDSANGDRTASGGGPPLSPRSRKRGRIRSCSGRDCAAPASAPTGSLRLATSPKTAGGGWVADGGGSTKRIELAPDGGPLPRPLPVRSSRRGENSIALRQAGTMGGSPRTQLDPVRTAVILPTPNLPQTWGRCEPKRAEGAPAGRAEADPSAQPPLPHSRTHALTHFRTPASAPILP
jgi:hypothetical protein